MRLAENGVDDGNLWKFLSEINGSRLTLYYAHDVYVVGNNIAGFLIALEE